MLEQVAELGWNTVGCEGSLEVTILVRQLCLTAVLQTTSVCHIVTKQVTLLSYIYPSPCEINALATFWYLIMAMENPKNQQESSNFKAVIMPDSSGWAPSKSQRCLITGGRIPLGF